MQTNPSLEKIASTVCFVFNIGSDQLMSRCRKPKETDAKLLYALFANRHYTESESGEFIGFDHSTIHNNRESALRLLSCRHERYFRGKAGNIAFMLYDDETNIPTKEEFNSKRDRTFSATGKMIGYSRRRGFENLTITH